MAPKVRLQLRRGTAAAWTSADPTLADGEEGYETDTGKRKIGDGSTAWTGLSYMASGGAAALDDLTDVNAPSPTDQYVLTWDNGTSKWIAAPAAGGAPTGAAGGDLSGTYPNPSVVDESHAHSATSVTTHSTAHAHSATTGQTANDHHTEDHDHDGSPTQKLLQANSHQSPDTDTGTSSLHHTLGTGANQAAAGNDSRLSDSRAPSGSAGGDLSGSYPNPSVVNSSHDHDATTAPGDPHTALRAVDFLVGTASAETSAEIVVGTTPGGELGGTWAAPTVDPNHAGEYVLMGGDITIADTYTTIASQAVTLAAGKGLLIECSGLVLNNSGSARTYTIALDIGGTLVEVGDGATVGASATNHSPLDFLGGISVQSSSLTYLWARSIRFGPSAANTATTMAGLSSIRGTWNSSTSDFTGAQTIIVKIKSSAVTATQTFHRMVTRIRLV